jgi:hypothetical protein
MADDSPGDLSNDMSSLPLAGKTLTDLPNEILLLVIARVDFSPENMLSLSLVNRRLNSLMVDHKQQLLNDIGTIQYPEAECMRPLFKEGKDHTVSTLQRSRKSTVSIRLIAEVLFHHSGDYEASVARQTMSEALHLFETLHHLGTLRDYELFCGAMTAHIKSETLRLMHLVTYWLANAMQVIQRLAPASQWNRVSLTRGVEYALQDLLLKRGVDFFAGMLLSFLPGQAARLFLGRTLTDFEALNSVLTLPSSSYLPVFKSAHYDSKSSTHFSFPWQWTQYFLSTNSGMDNVQTIPIRRATWSTVMHGSIIWDLLNLSIPSCRRRMGNILYVSG